MSAGGRVRGQTTANCKLGLRFLRSLRSDSSHLIRKTRNGAMPSRLGRKSDTKHQQGPGLWKDGDENSDDDRDDNDCHDGDPTAWGARIRSVVGASKTPEGAGTRRTATATHAVSRKPSVGQWRQDQTRKFPLQTSSCRTASSSVCLGNSNSTLGCVDRLWASSISLEGYWDKAFPPGIWIPATHRETSRSKHEAFHAFVTDPPFFLCSFPIVVWTLPVRRISFFRSLFCGSEHFLDCSSVTRSYEEGGL